MSPTCYTFPIPSVIANRVSIPASAATVIIISPYWTRPGWHFAVRDKTSLINWRLELVYVAPELSSGITRSSNIRSNNATKPQRHGIHTHGSLSCNYYGPCTVATLEFFFAEASTSSFPVISKHTFQPQLADIRSFLCKRFTKILDCSDSNQISV